MLGPLSNSHVEALTACFKKGIKYALGPCHEAETATDGGTYKSKSNNNSSSSNAGYATRACRGVASPGAALALALSQQELFGALGDKSRANSALSLVDTYLGPRDPSTVALVRARYNQRWSSERFPRKSVPPVPHPLSYPPHQDPCNRTNAKTVLGNFLGKTGPPADESTSKGLTADGKEVVSEAVTAGVSMSFGPKGAAEAVKKSLEASHRLKNWANSLILGLATSLSANYIPRGHGQSADPEVTAGAASNRYAGCNGATAVAAATAGALTEVRNLAAAEQHAYGQTVNLRTSQAAATQAARVALRDALAASAPMACPDWQPLSTPTSPTPSSTNASSSSSSSSSPSSSSSAEQVRISASDEQQQEAIKKGKLSPGARVSAVGAARLLLRQAVLELEVAAAASNVGAAGTVSSAARLPPTRSTGISSSHSSSVASVATALEALAQECADYYQRACYAEHAELLSKSKQRSIEKGENSANDNDKNDGDDVGVAAAAGAALVVNGRLSPRLERIGRR